MFRQHVLSRKSDGERPSRGQSVVEFALVLPILMLIVAGTLEVGNLLTFYNRVQLAAREGARFAAAGGSGVETVIAQASELSLDMDPRYMTVWVIRPTITAPNNDPASWYWTDSATTPPWGVTEECVFGNACGDPDNGVPADPSLVTAQRALDDVKDAKVELPRNIDGTTFDIVVVYYQVDTILNLPFWRADGTTTEGRVPIWAYGVMAQEVEDSAVAMKVGGCSAYSLIIENDVFSGFHEGDVTDWIYLDEPTSGSVGGFSFVGWQYDHTVKHWVFDNAHPDRSSMPYPGTSIDPVYGFIEYDEKYAAGNPADYDTALHRNDWVVYNYARVAEANQPLYQATDSHLRTERAIRVLIYDKDDTSNPSPASRQFGSLEARWQFQVVDFAIVRVVDEQHGGTNALKFEFVGWDRSCGYDTSESN